MVVKRPKTAFVN